jgi:hypothetical protein
MDEDVDPIVVERMESMFSSPLFRMSNTTPLCDTSTELAVLLLSRYWSWTPIRQTPVDFDLRGDALSILCSHVFSASLAAVESFFIDKHLSPSSRLRAIYALVIGFSRWRSHGIIGSVAAQLFGGGDSFLYPSHYLPSRGVAYLTEAAIDVLSFFWRLIRWNRGPDLLYLFFKPLVAVAYVLTVTVIFIFDTQTPQHFLGWALLPNIEQDSQSAIAVNTAILGLVVLFLFRRPLAAIHLFARLPDVNRRNLKRGARLLRSWKKRPEEENYVHRPLRKAREIRLLQLMPRNSFRPNVIRAELLHVPIDAAPEYECVSYTWGDLSRICDSFILVEGKWFACAPKVHDMLVDLTTSSERLIWIDWFCINQTDPGEKSAQVSLMRDIFRGAAKVIAWLEPLHDVVPMRRLVEDVASQFRRRASDHDGTNIVPESIFQSRSEAEVIALLRFFKNDWFHRVWIVQEAALSNVAPTVFYGKDTFEWKVLMHLARGLLSNDWALHLGELTTTERSEVHHALHSAVIMNALGSMVQKCQPIELAVALQECSIFKASYPVDKVFALMGFTGDTYHRGIQPDYSQPVEKVYASTAQYLYSFLVSGSNSGFHSTYPLRILHMAGVGIERKIANLPSWVPDWSVPYPSRILTRTEISETDLRPYRSSAALQVSGGLFLADETEVLRLKGTVVDVVSVMGDPLDYHYTSPISNPYSAVIAAGKHMESVDPEKPPDFEHPELQDVAKLSSWHMQAGMLRDAEVDDPYITKESAQDAFWLTLVGNTVGHPEQKGHLQQQDEMFQKFLDNGRHVLRQLEGKDRWDGHYLLDVITKYRTTFIHTGRRFAVTENGYMGLVPAGTQYGDLVCIIYGAQTPFLLRPRPGGNYLIVGECYIHGMMDGEMASDGLEAEWFDTM